jgi:hypothetical protein
MFSSGDLFICLSVVIRAVRLDKRSLFPVTQAGKQTIKEVLSGFVGLCKIGDREI